VHCRSRQPSTLERKDDGNHDRKAQVQPRATARHAGCSGGVAGKRPDADGFHQPPRQGDWGEVCQSDKALNDQALADGSRLLSAYTTLKGVKIWIITEAADDEGHRAATTCLLPSEY